MEFKDKIQELIAGFKFEKQVPRKERMALTIWICPEERIKYDILQAKSARSFSKLIQNVVRETIHQAEAIDQGNKSA